MTDTKEARNARIQARYDELMREGAHGHYETLFRVMQEEVRRERSACQQIAAEYGGYDAEEIAELIGQRNFK